MKLKKDILITLFSNLVLAFSQWVLIASLNYSGNIGVVGQYSYALALAGFFLTVGQVGLRQYILSSSINVDQLEQLFVTRLLASILTWGLLVLYALLVVDDIYFWLVLLIGLAKIAENMSDLAHGFYQRKFMVMQIARSRIARSIFTPLVFLGVFFNTDNISYACVAMLITWVIIFMVFDKEAMDTKQQGLNKVNFVPVILVNAYPLGITSVLVLLVVSMPLFILAKMADDIQVGQYASVFYFVTAGSLIMQSVLQVISPIIVAHLKDRLHSNIITLAKNCYLLAIAYGLIGVFLAVYIGEWVLQLVYGDSFNGLGSLVVLAALINLALAIQAVGGIVLTAHGIFKFQMKVMSFSVLISAIAGYYCIINFGVSGAFYAGLLTALVIGICFGFRVIQELRK
ncbi:hypothetical protein [uncultured Paraglaciecola sp.]|uniref:lipopolysaccharide biosynthesis protein n=1 Tax=uncultured Paraglaciecola sp. TaxID=1765024 RepID=UPI0025D50D9A|nr:hypothetical protein [uncultured Paraglaciecola sp.]